MKKKIFKLLGVAVTLGLVLSFVFATLPTHAAVEKINEWYTFDYPVEGADGDWFYSPDIATLGPMAEAINGDLYIGVGPESELTEVASGIADWSTAEAHSGSYSVKLTAPTLPDYGKVTLSPITGAFSSFSAPSFYYRISSDAVATTEDIGGTWPIYVRLGDTVTQGYLSPYPVIHIYDGVNEHWIIGQPWAESTQVGWTLWDNSQASSHWSEACWHNESFTNLTGGPVDAGWEPLSAWQTEYSDYDVVDIGIGLGFFAVTGQQSAYVDDLTIGGTTYDLGPSGEPQSHLFKSTDGGRTWEETEYDGGAVVDMVCSSIDEDIVYVTDGWYVYKTEDGGDEWDFLARDSLETLLGGDCGCTICSGCFSPNWRIITSIDVTYDDDDNPFVFIGTRAHAAVGCSAPCVNQKYPGDVLYIGEAGYPANWTSLNLSCYGTGYGNLWSFLKGRAVELNASHILGEGFKERVAKTVGEVKYWDIKDTNKAVFLTEANFYEHFIADLLKAKRRVVLYTPFIGKTRWPFVAPYIAMLRDRNVEVFLLHKPLTDPEWRRYDRDFGRKVFNSLAHLGVRLIHMSGVHAKTIVVDSQIVYDGSLNWASQTSSREHMWRFESPDMAKLVEKMLQLDPITYAFNQVNVGDRCPNCGGPLILINQANQQPRDHYPLRFGCERWNENKRTCTGYLRPVGQRVPFLKPPRCPRGTIMHVHYTKEGRPWDWRCGHKGCRPIRWVRGDCLDDFAREAQGQKNRNQTKAKEPKIKQLKLEPKLPKDLLIQVKKLSQQGLSLDEIAGSFGVSIEVLQESIDSVRQQIDKLMEEIFKDEDHPNNSKAQDSARSSENS